MSLPEVLLWQELRGKKSGVKFRRQHAAGRYILDFYCAELNFAVEVDGSAHDGIEAAEYDMERTGWLNDNGIEVLRIRAKDVLENMEGAVLKIRTFASRMTRDNSPRNRQKSEEEKASQ